MIHGHRQGERPQAQIALGTWRQLGAAAYLIRTQVFVREQGVPLGMELDELDARACHVLASFDGVAVGTARLLVGTDGVASIGRVAVLADCRGVGVGKQLTQCLIAEARRQRASGLELHAQRDAIGFYAQLGFEVIGETFVEAGIEHRSMRYNFGAAD